MTEEGLAAGMRRTLADRVPAYAFLQAIASTVASGRPCREDNIAYDVQFPSSLMRCPPPGPT